MNGPQLKNIREGRKLTQAALAQELGTNDSNVSRWEKSEDELPEWVQSKMFQMVKIHLPVEDLYRIVDLATNSPESLDDILGAAIRNYLDLKTKKPSPIKYEAGGTGHGTEKAAEESPKS